MYTTSFKLSAILSLLLLTTALFSQIGAKMQQGGLHGQWQNDEFGVSIKLQINADGSGVFDGEAFTYTTQGNKITFFITGTTTTYSYQIQGNSLTLSEGDLDGPISFLRSENGQVASGPKITTSSSDISGTWSGNGETIEFKPDGQCNYLGQTFPYTLSQGHVTFSTAGGSIMFAYAIQGDQLSLSANGQTVSYTRGSGSSGRDQLAQASGSGQVPVELTGQWCWIDVNSYNQGSSASSRCITLNADGTYEYSSEASRSVNTPDYYGGTNTQESDRGTWYVQGDRIYYTSPTTGQGSYRLEKRNHPKNVNDPMIVLDGEAYVTTTQRQPWR